SAGIAQPPPLNSPASPAASLAGSRTGQHRRQQQQQRSQRQQHLDESTVTSTCALADLDDLDSLDGAGGAPADDPDQLSQALLRMSTDPVDCSRLRQGQPFGLVLPLLYGPETRDPCPESRCPSPHASLPPRPVRDRAAQILANLAACPEAGAKEKLILCHLDQVRAYCDAVRAVLCRCGQLASLSSPPPAEVAVDALRDRCCSALSVLLELSYSDTDRPAIAELGGVECLSDLLLVDFCRTQYRPPPCSLFLRRYAASALTNLSYGDAACKRRVCLRAPAVWSLVEQLKSPPGLAVGVAQPVEEELCQVTAAVIRNLSWQADAECRAVLGRLGAAGVLTRAALQVRRETTLRSLLSALWNLSAHSTANKEAICAVPGSLSLLCACLTCNPSLAETGGGVLRNISSVVAVREDLRSAVRPAFPVLLTQLRSASLTVVANACGILWNLSSNHLADQRLLTRLGAVPMLRCLIQSKHKPLSASVHYNSSGQSELTLPQCVRLAGSVAGGQDGTDGCAGASASVTAAAAVAESTAATPAASASASAPGGSVQPTPLVFSRGSSGHSLDSVGLDSLRSSRASSYSAGTGGRSAGPPLSPSYLPDTPSEPMQPPQPQLVQQQQQQQQPQTRTVQRSTQPQQIPGAAGRHRRPGSASKASSAASSSSKDEDDGLDSQILQDCIRSGMPPSRAHAAAKTITTVTDDRPTVFHVEHTPSPPSSVDLNYGAADGAPAQQQQQQQQQQSAPALSLGLARGVEERDDDDDEVDEVAAALAIEDEEDEEEAIDIGLGIEDEEDELDEHEVAGNVIHEEDDEEDIGPVQSGVGAAVAGRSTRGAVGVQCDEKTVTYKTEDTPAHFSYRTSAQTSSRSSSCSSDNADQLLEACISSAMPKKQQQQLAAARARPAIDSNGEGGDSSASSNSKASFFWIGFDGRKQRPQQQQQPLAESASSEAGPSKPKTQASLTGAARHQHRLPPPAPPRQPAPGSSSSSSKIHLVHQHHRLACRLHAGTDRRLYTLTEERSSPSPVELRDADRQSSSGGSRTSADAPGRPVDSRTFSIHSDEEPAAGQLTLELSDIDTSDLSGSSMEIDAAAIRESPHASATNAELTAEVDASQDTDTDLDLTDDEDDGDATGALFGQVKPPAAPSPVPIASVRHVPAVSQLPAPKPIVAGTSWVPVSPSAIASGTASSRLPMPASTVRPQAGASSKPSTIPTPVMASTPAKPSSSASSIAAPSSKLTPPSSSVLRQQQQQQPMLSGAGKPLGIVAPTPVRSAPPAPSSTSISAGRRSKDSGYSDASPAGSLDGSPAQRFTLQVTSSASSTSASASIHRQQSPITFNLTISSGGGGGDSEAGSTICDEDDVSADIEDVSSSRLDSPPAPSASSAAGVGRARIVKRPKSVDGAPGPPRKLIGGGGGRGGSAGRGRVSSISGSPVRQPQSIRRANATNVRLNKSAVARLGGGITSIGSQAQAQTQMTQKRALPVKQLTQQQQQQQMQKPQQRQLLQKPLQKQKQQQTEQ
uniref:Armadillo repeat-containing protein 5 n=2 Tax=Macrostomum lignano TaxID=282301 RepID=A0A1I8J120_9PLAT